MHLRRTLTDLRAVLAGRGAAALAAAALLTRSVSADAPLAPGLLGDGSLFARVQSDGSLVHDPTIPLANGRRPVGPGLGRTVALVPPIDFSAAPSPDADGNLIYPLQPLELEPRGTVLATGVFDGSRFICDTISVGGPPMPTP